MRHSPTLSLSLHHKRVLSAACGAEHSFVIVRDISSEDPKDNTIYSWGKCNFGQLGNGYQDVDRHTPTRVSALDDKGVVLITAGNSHSIALTEGGELWTWGCGFSGALGHNSEHHLSIPTMVESLSAEKIIGASAGKAHTAVVSSDGKIYCWGANNSGQLGNNSNISRKVPNLIETDTKFVQVACGSNHSLALDSDGNVWGWGDNLYKQLGDLVHNSENNDSTAGEGQSKNGNSSEENIVCAPRKIHLDRKIIQIGCGLHFSFAIDEENYLWMWGDNIGNFPFNLFI